MNKKKRMARVKAKRRMKKKEDWCIHLPISYQPMKGMSGFDADCPR